MSFVHWNAFGAGFPAEDGANLPRVRTESFTTHAINLWAQIKTLFVRRFGLAIRRYAGKQRDLGSDPLWLSFLFKNCGLCMMDTVL